VYKETLKEAMNLLGQQPNTIFLGQGVVYQANAMFDTFSGVHTEKKIELPVAEDMQMGMSIGLAINGYLPISVYPRMDFLICAMNQLVNHIDKIEELSHGLYKPKVIIRTMVGSKFPLDAGLQHTGNYTDMLRVGLKNVRIYELNDTSDIMESYIDALNRYSSSILIEYGGLY
jgi:pyruvate/2-oxoglutarate/acetoin dehydrogenase E1 component